MVALIDKDKYRGDLKVLELHLEHFMGMERAARAKAKNKAEEDLYLWMLVGEELRKAGFEFDGDKVREPFAFWPVYDETGEQVGIKYSQGNMAVIT